MNPCRFHVKNLFAKNAVSSKFLDLMWFYVIPSLKSWFPFSQVVGHSCFGASPFGSTHAGTMIYKTLDEEIIVVGAIGRDGNGHPACCPVPAK